MGVIRVLLAISVILGHVGPVLGIDGVGGVIARYCYLRSWYALGWELAPVVNSGRKCSRGSNIIARWAPALCLI